MIDNPPQPRQRAAGRAAELHRVDLWVVTAVSSLICIRSGQREYLNKKTKLLARAADGRPADLAAAARRPHRAAGEPAGQRADAGGPWPPTRSPGESSASTERHCSAPAHKTGGPAGRGSLPSPAGGRFAVRSPEGCQFRTSPRLPFVFVDHSGTSPAGGRGVTGRGATSRTATSWTNDRADQHETRPARPGPSTHQLARRWSGSASPAPWARPSVAAQPGPERRGPAQPAPALPAPVPPAPARPGSPSRGPGSPQDPHREPRFRGLPPPPSSRRGPPPQLRGGGRRRRAGDRLRRAPQMVPPRPKIVVRRRTTCPSGGSSGSCAGTRCCRQAYQRRRLGIADFAVRVAPPRSPRSRPTPPSGQLFIVLQPHGQATASAASGRRDEGRLVGLRDRDPVLLDQPSGLRVDRVESPSACRRPSSPP